MKNLRNLMVRGTAWLAGGQVVTLGVGFLLTPFIIRRLGAESYGALNLTVLVINYIMFSDLGQGLASTKFATEAHVEGDDTRETEIVWTSLMLVFIATTIATLVVGFMATYIVVRLLPVPLRIQQPTILALRLACVGYLVRSLISVLNTPMMVRMQMGLYAAINSGSNILQTILTFLAVVLGGGLVAASGVGAAVGFISTFTMAAFAVKLQPKLINPRIRSVQVAPLLRFGIPFMISGMVGVFISQGERLILARFLGVKELAYYTVAFTVSGLIDLIPNSLSQTMLPAFTQARASGGNKALKSIAWFTTRTILIYTVPAAAFLVLVGRRFLSIWAGPDFARMAFIPLIILVFAKFVEMTSYSPRVQIVVLGRPDFIPKIQIMEVLPYLAIGTILTLHYGIVGSAATWSLRALVECLVVWAAANRMMGATVTDVPAGTDIC